MRWFHIEVLKLLPICLIVIPSDTVSAESNVGCLFSPELCETNEICINDNAFGRCAQQDSAEQDDKLDLNLDTLRLLEREMKRLYEEGYRWDNEYTQCSIRQILYAYRNNRFYDPGLCSRLLSMSRPVMTPELAMNLAKLVDPRDLALVEFESANDFAKEDYQPSLMDNRLVGESERLSKRRLARYEEDLEEGDLNKVGDVEDGQAYDNQKELLNSQVANLLNAIADQVAVEEQVASLSQQNKPAQYASLSSDFTQKPIFTEAGIHWIDADEDPLETPQKGYPREDPFQTEGLSNDENQANLLDTMVNEDPSMAEDGGEEDKMAPENRWSFYRQHRYDIKKPGPTYFVHEPESGENEKTNPVASSDGKANSPKNQASDGVTKKSGPKNDLSPPKSVDSSSATKYSHLNWQQDSNLMKEVADQRPLEAVDGRYTFLHFIGRLESWKKGEDLVRKLESLLNLPRGTFSNIRVQNDQVIFKVNPNSLGLNASTIAGKAYEMKNLLHKETSLLLDSSGIGNKVKRGAVQSASDGLVIEPVQQHLTVLTVLTCLTVISVLVAGVIVYAVRRNRNLKSRLRSLIGSLSGAEEGQEATSDYEDLCRQRMQTKACKEEKSEKAESKKQVEVQPASKSDLKGNENGPEPSPPSRSSTSSWSEEPITSNLDISTGHMILSYMEDHLKNKDRLAKEWEALCAYEVDPCSTTAATLTQNQNKNRFADVLPFDHSRVILNDLTNSNRSDYINASTITDHDPRSPVYIVTQGPLPHTCADFWQMVWEQGSTIIVMLTRLMENGVASSTRYWPEEGSASYGSFEVHLVSEHIWCDDYLVRSFFLKNAKTNETRTVTQFHYLSWPENGVPPNPKSILEFRRKVNKSYRGRSCPIVVHCSDGIGRTGTYCLIDMVLNRIAKGAKEIDIAATLEHIRDQRGNSVKNKAQFEFVLEAIAEEVTAILKTLKSN